ncbi:MAG TPA: Mu transposase C-terminal domain-containing protein [Ktedonobacteraceae bacterium]|nr:Mu transposase C-terminal domain-containing protein [Ktedonobacteraceae bacterium]
MNKPDSSPTTPRQGTPGIDIFKIAGASISGYFNSYKTGDKQLVRIPFVSTQEFKLGLLYLEYHPHVVRFQRGDVSPEFARAHRHATPLPVPLPYRINYPFERKSHEYWPDYIGTLSDGGLLIAEAGLTKEKLKGQALAKADAARRVAQLKGGEYWIATEQHLSDRRFKNLLFLHRCRDAFGTFDEIAAALRADWPWGEERCVREIIKHWGSRWSDDEVEAAVWKIVGDAAAAGRLVVDLSEVLLDLDTPLNLLDPEAPPILPDPLPDSLEGMLAAEQSPLEELIDDEEAEATVLSDDGLIPGPAYDPEDLDKESRETFNRNRDAVMAVLSGQGVRQVAEANGMVHSALLYLIKRVNEYGQIALVPYGVYHRDPELRPAFQEKIRKLYKSRMRPTVRAVERDPELRALAEELTKLEGKLVKPPTYRQVWWFIKRIENERDVVEARSGLKHPPRSRMSPTSFVRSITAPGLICQVDEHHLDILVVTRDGTVVTHRVHGAVLICVKTAAILGAVLSLDSLKEEDYMRLIKQAIERKDKLVRLYDCKNPWPCYGKPGLVFHDRGDIFTSERAQRVLVERFHITTERAPAFCPKAKGTVEALFVWVMEEVTHRLPGTTKANPKDRGAYPSAQEAAKAGITLDVLEMYFIRAITDRYMLKWNDLRNQTPQNLWNDAVRQYGIPKWLGSQDDLKLMLMKAQNRKNPATGRYAIQDDRISFLGRWYVSPGVLNQLRGKEIDIYYDRNDISVIYLFLEGLHVGDAYCAEFMGQRVSLWEANTIRRASAPLKKAAEAESLRNHQEILVKARSGKRRQYEESVRMERKRLLDLRDGEIHTDQANAVARALREQLHLHDQEESPAPRSGGFTFEEDEEDRPVRPLAIRPRRKPNG